MSNQPPPQAQLEALLDDMSEILSCIQRIKATTTLENEIPKLLTLCRSIEPLLTALNEITNDAKTREALHIEIDRGVSNKKYIARRALTAHNDTISALFPLK